MKKISKFSTSLLALALAVSSFAGPGDGAKKKPIDPPPFEYNPGPDPSTKMGRELVDIYAGLPEYMDMSKSLMEKQKFRYIFGMMMTRANFDENGVKILFIGQDATHIAEAAKQPGTSGFGARVQSIGNFFGADRSVATTNAFLSTINGQYGAFDHLYVETVDGKAVVRQSAYVDNELWMLANGKKSQVMLSRERFWEWMIKNNPESLNMMLTFGGAARDAWAEFLIKRGATVGTKFNPERLKSVQVPETKLVNAGGNNEFPVPIDRDGKDVYETLLRKKHDAATFRKKYGKKKGNVFTDEIDYSKASTQTDAVQALKDAGDAGIGMMVFTGGGVDGSGVVNAAQLGGYDLDNIVINGQKTHSLKGLVLSDGYVVTRDIAFASSPHPTMLSKMKPEEASASLKKSFSVLNELKQKGWKVQPDLDEDGSLRHNFWDEGKDYKYGRADIRPGYFEFGAPKDRRVSRADASRLNPQTIIAGSRDKQEFDKTLLQKAKEGVPSKPLDPNDLWSVRPRQSDTRYVFDRGPGEENAKLMWTSIDETALFEPKPGMKVIDPKTGEDITFETHGISAYYTKTSPSTGLHGFHRGDLDKASIFILADPHGIDEWNTSRAMTGERGQYLNGLMEDLGFGENYSVLRTVPVGMDGATAEEWEVVRKRTENYRDVMLKRAFDNPNVTTFFTDGDVAKAEMERVMKKYGVVGKTVINIRRDGMKADSGIVEAANAFRKSGSGFIGRSGITAHLSDIPRSHLPWWARSWEGTGGDHVVDALGKQSGAVHALVCPDYVVKQSVIELEDTKNSIAAIKRELDEAGIRLGNEPVRDFLDRKKLGSGSFAFTEQKRLNALRLKGSADGHPNVRARAMLTPGECLKLITR